MTATTEPPVVPRPPIGAGPPAIEPPGTSTGPDGQFAAFYHRELTLQVRRAALLVGDRDLAHDLVHDAFVDLYRRWSELRDPGPYLSRAVLNRCRDHGRRKATRDRRLPLLIERGVPEDEILWDTLQRLPFNQRAAVVLRFYQQMTEPEIAVLLDCRPGSVGPWINRGLKALRKELS